MRDLAEGLARDDGEMMRLRHDRRRVNGSSQRTRVDRRDRITHLDCRHRDKFLVMRPDFMSAVFKCDHGDLEIENPLAANL